MPDTSTIHCKDNQVSPDENWIEVEEMPVLMLDYTGIVAFGLLFLLSQKVFGLSQATV